MADKLTSALKAAKAIAKAGEDAPAVNRLDMSFKDVTKRVPELTEVANMLARGEMTAAQYDALVRRLKPVTPYNFVPQPATAKDAMRALNEGKRQQFGKTAEMTAGEQADLRLDIPAYKEHGVWVNSIHRKNQPTVYGSTSSVKNATMIGAPDKALKVAQGAPKAPFAVIRGEWNPMDEAAAVESAQKYLNHPEWKQVGYDPERHGFFYDRASMAPVLGAEEVIQIGPLVLAKNPKYGKLEDFPFKQGGLARFEGGGRAGRAISGLKALSKLADEAPPPPHWAVHGLPRVPLPPPVSLANKERMLAESMEKRRMYHGTRHKPQVLHRQTGTSQPLTEYDWQGNVVTAKPMPPIPEEGLTSLMPSQRRGLIFTTPDPEFASSYASGVSLSPLEGGQVYPVRVHTKNPFDYENPEHVKAVADAMRYGKQSTPLSIAQDATREDMIHALRTGDWAYIEDPEVLNTIRRLGFDGAYMREANTKNLGVFRPEQVKSDIGNIGTYDVTNPDMTKRKGGLAHFDKGGKTGKGRAGAVVSGLKAVSDIVGDASNAAKATSTFDARLLQRTADKMTADLAAKYPNLGSDAIMDKALREAEKKLKWERENKPALVATYGPLARASYSDSKLNKMRNTQPEVEKRIKMANDFLDIPTEPWTPPRPELQAFDRSLIKDSLEGFPGVSQSKFPRDLPTRTGTSHVDDLYTDPTNRELIIKQIKRGLPLGGETFYGSLYPIKQAALDAGIPAEQFERWVHSIAPASARNSIMNEMASGQFLRDMHARGIPLTEENVAMEMAKYKQKYGIGLPLMDVHRTGTRDVLEGGKNLREASLANEPTNYKIPTYGSQKAGDFANSVVIDTHEAAGQTLGSQYHPYFREQGGMGNLEYNAGEQGLLGIAKELGIPGGMAQAGRWLGGGELTGLRSPRGDALDLLERQAAYTLKQEGKQANPHMIREMILNQIKTGEGNLLPWYRKEGMPDVRETGLQRKDGGEVSKSFDQRLKEAIGKHMAEGGEVKQPAIKMPVTSLRQLQTFDEGGAAYGNQPMMRAAQNIRERRGIESPEKRQEFSDKVSAAIRKRIGEQYEKEKATLSTPEGRRDTAMGVVANTLGTVPDLLNLGLEGADYLASKVPAFSKPESVMNPQGPRVAASPLASERPYGGSQQWREAFEGAGLMGDKGAPVTEFVGSMLAPVAVAKAPRAIEGGLNAATAAARRPFIPATITTEAVAPDLAKFKSRDWQDLATKKMIGEEGVVPMDVMGGRRTTHRPGQGVYMNEEGKLELNPMVGIDVPGAGNLAKNRALRADIATAGGELNQEAMAAHRFVPMATNQIKDASAMMITGPGGRALTREEVIQLGDSLPGMIVTHSPRTGGVMVAPFEMTKGKIPAEFLQAQKVANTMFGKKANIQYGKAEQGKDLMYMPRSTYAEEGARAPSPESQAMRTRLKKMEQVLQPVGSRGGLGQVRPALASTAD